MKKPTGKLFAFASIMAISMASLLSAVTPTPESMQAEAKKIVLEFVTESSDPASLSQKTSSEIKSRPEIAAYLTVELVDVLGKNLSGKRMEEAVALFFSEIAEKAPNQVLDCLRAASAKHPDLAICMASAVAGVIPSMAQEVARTIVDAAPTVNRQKLAEVLASTAGGEASDFSFLWDNSTWDYFSGLPGGAGARGGGGGGGGGRIYSE